MPNTSVKVMLNALKHLGQPIEPEESSKYEGVPIQNLDDAYTQLPETLEYKWCSNPGTFVGYTEHSNIARGRRMGIGKMTYNNGDVYFGKWENDHMNGDGKFSKKNEHGKLFWEFEGEFQNNCPKKGKLIEGTREIESDEWEYKTVFDQKPTQPNSERRSRRPLSPKPQPAGRNWSGFGLEDR